ncbi:MAG: hypothetical protein ACKVQC_10055 [Elusimicrobiota bacterium]
MKSFFKISVATQAILLTGFMIFSGCKNGNLAGFLNDSGSGGTAATLSDANLALAEGNYSRSLELYNSILVHDPNNSDALYGAAAAELGSSGLDFGQLVSNLVTNSALLGSSVKNMGDFISQGNQHPSSSINCAGLNSILLGINCEALNAVIDRVICRLQKIASGGATGTITSNDIPTLVNFGVTCLIRAILRPLRAGLLDIRNNNGDFAIVYSVDMTTACNQQPTVITGMVSDIAGAYSLFNKVVNLLNLSQNQVIRQLRDDIDTVGTKMLTTGGPNAMPAACLNLLQTNLGINVSNFKTRLEAFDPPASSC